MFMLETSTWPFNDDVIVFEVSGWSTYFSFKDYILVQAGYMKVALARFKYDKYTTLILTLVTTQDYSSFQGKI